MLSLALTLVAAFAASASAQSVQIIGPRSGETVFVNHHTSIELNIPTVVNQTTIGVAVGLKPCSETNHVPCTDAPSDAIGRVMYAGNFTAGQNITAVVPSIPLQQNGQQLAVMSVVHSFLEGPGPVPKTEVVNVTVDAQACNEGCTVP